VDLNNTQVLCGHVPYHDLVHGTVAMWAIVEGNRPKKPEKAAQLGFTEELWETVEQCWSEDRNARPGAEAINSRLTEAVPFWYMRE